MIVCCQIHLTIAHVFFEFLNYTIYGFFVSEKLINLNKAVNHRGHRDKRGNSRVHYKNEVTKMVGHLFDPSLCFSLRTLRLCAINCRF